MTVSGGWKKTKQNKEDSVYVYIGVHYKKHIAAYK